MNRATATRLTDRLEALTKRVDFLTERLDSMVQRDLQRIASERERDRLRELFKHVPLPAPARRPIEGDRVENRRGELGVVMGERDHHGLAPIRITESNNDASMNEGAWVLARLLRGDESGPGWWLV